MKHLAKLAVLASLVATPAFASPMKLTYAQIVTLSNGLGALDGSQQVVKDGSQEHVVVSPYDFTVGARTAFAGDEAALQTVITSEQGVLRTLAKSLGPDVQKAGSSAQTQFNEAAQGISEKSFSVDLITFDVAEFNLGKNAIPPSVLAALAPIITDLMPKPAAK